MDNVVSAYSARFRRIVEDIQGSEDGRAHQLKRSALAFGTTIVLCGALVLVLTLLRIFDISAVAVLVAMLLAAALTSVTLWLLRLQRYAIALKFFLYGVMLYVSMAIPTVGGVTGPIFVAYLIPMMVAGLFGKAGDVARLFVIALICYLLLTILEYFGQLTPALVFTGGSQMITFVISFSAVGALLAYMSALWSGSTAHFAQRLQDQSEALLSSNEKLMEKNFQQVELGSELSVAATQLLASSHQQASGATEQASAVSQVSTTIEELGSTARQIAIAAEQVAEAAQQTLDNLSEGQDAVDRSIQAMERIRSRVQDVSTRVLSLGERSQQIGEIIDLINDLSDETHLLALNAAIEAAGAGEHGRRFAVVAAEVKSLANRALTAAKEVKGVIAEIQQATNAAVLAAEEGGKEVERGVELAHSAGQVMDAIVLVAERTAQSGSEISLATAQQQSASEQVVETMREVADVARQTAAGARQMAESAQMLTAIAERLHGIASSQPAGTENEFGQGLTERMRKIAAKKE